MPRECEVCGKKGGVGNTIIRRGLAKKKGGIGLHTTGVTRRHYKANLQRVRVRENGGVVRKRVCTSCIRSGKIEKA